MFEDFETIDPQGICSTFYRVMKMLCLLVAYVVTLSGALIAFIFSVGFVAGALLR